MISLNSFFFYVDECFSEARKLIEQAAQAGVPEAQKTLDTICAQGGCEI
jgi:hypothetical protein